MRFHCPFHYDIKWLTPPLQSTPGPFSALELNYDVPHTRAPRDFWSFQWWTLPQRLWTSDWHGHRSPNLQYFSTTILNASTSTMVQYLSRFKPISHFPSQKARNNLMDSLMIFYLKRGIATMPVLIHKKLSPGIHFRALHCPQATTYQSQSFVDLSLWMLKGSLDIRAQLREDPISAEHSISSQTMTSDPDGLLMNSGRIYVPDPKVLRPPCSPYSHDHPLETFRSDKTLHQVRCTTIARTPVLSRHWQINVPSFPCQACAPQPYRLLKQLLILVKPWNSISMIS